MPSQLAPVVVGYDGSPASQVALDWAVVEAIRQHAPLRIVEVFDLVIAMQPMPGNAGPLLALRANREKAMQAVVDDLLLQHPVLQLTTAVIEDTPGAGLVEESTHARAVVIGSRGLGGWTGLMAGSVAVQVSTHAHCPVVVIPADLRPRGQGKPTIIVGVDGSKTSAQAVEFAFTQAELRGATVIAVHAWRLPLPVYDGGQGSLVFGQPEIDESSRLLVSESLAGATADHPNVELEIRLVGGQAARALLTAAEAADLLVVGSRGRGGFTGLLLGSVSQAVLHHAHCPVAIVR